MLTVFLSVVILPNGKGRVGSSFFAVPSATFKVVSSKSISFFNLPAL